VSALPLLYLEPSILFLLGEHVYFQASVVRMTRCGGNYQTPNASTKHGSRRRRTWRRPCHRCDQGSSMGRRIRGVHGCGCNIPGFEVTNREETTVCIALMHRKSQEFLHFKLKHIKVIEVLLEFMELKYLINWRMINFNMTFVKSLFWVEKTTIVKRE
jgi:hypothetical protein